MKKTLIILLLALFISEMKGNVVIPRAWISEILVDSTGNWILEMGFDAYGNFDVDSVRMITSSGSSIISYYEVSFDGGTQPFDSLAVITNANLAVPLSVNPDGDFVRLVTYIWGDQMLDEVIFGNYPGSYLDCIAPGESVICYEWVQFCIDSSPTIGIGNYEGEGYSGHYSGVILDPSGNPITGGFVNIVGNAVLTLYPDEQGYFNNVVVSRRISFDTIKHYLPPWPNNVYTYTCEPVDFCLRPDSSYYHDIITTSLVMGVDDQEDYDENVVTVAPNPFSDKIIFFFNLKNNDAADIGFSIYSLDGRRIHHIFLSPDQKRYEWYPQNSITSGIYTYRLEKDRRIIKSGKFIRL